MRKPEHFSKPFDWQYYLVVGFLVFIWAGPALISLIILYATTQPTGFPQIGLSFPLIAIIIVSLMTYNYKRSYVIENRTLFLGRSIWTKKTPPNTYTIVRGKNSNRYFYSIACNNVKGIQINISKKEIQSIPREQRFHANMAPYIRIELQEPLKFEKTGIFGGNMNKTIDTVYISATQPNKLRMGIHKNR